MTRLRVFAPLLILSIGAVASEKLFFIGTWKIVGGTPAPWCDNDRKPSVDESRDLTGKLVTIEAKRISGPKQLACSKPKFEVKNYGPDMLFQGQFAEMKNRDKSVNITDAAAKAGFTGSTEWKTLETGCENTGDLHFLDAKTASFGLNNVIYTLKKQ